MTIAIHPFARNLSLNLCKPTLCFKKYKMPLQFCVSRHKPGWSGNILTTINVMKKNIFTTAVANEIIDRAKSLQSIDRPLWGSMNVAEMLRHCTLANTQIIQKELSYQPATLKQKCIGFLCLYVLNGFPKNVKGAESIETKGKVPVEKFSQELENFSACIQRFAKMDTPIQLTHPAFGNLSAKEWGVAIWMHMDHHLRQFGA